MVVGGVLEDRHEQRKRRCGARRRRAKHVTSRVRLIILALLIAATTMEVTGDALVRNGLAQRALVAKLPYFVAGALLLFGYGLTLNLAPIAFHKVVGIYIAVLFVVWQIVSYAAYRSIPGPPILIGGTLIICGGLIVAFWQTGEPS
jgi:small multidrug resistance family-3 protein